MKISVVIPTFNAEKYVMELLESIGSQSQLPHEIVISDDASTDRTVELAHSFAAKSAIPLKVLNHQRAGISANYENALFASIGDVVIVGDHDDVWLPKKIERITLAFTEHPEVSLVSSDSEILNENLVRLGSTLRGGSRESLKQAKHAAKDDFKFFLLGGRLAAHTLAFSGRVREIMKAESASRFDGFWFENRVCAAALCFGRLLLLPEALTLYRQHPNQRIGFQKQTILEKFSREPEVLLCRLNTLHQWLEKYRSLSALNQAEVERRLNLLTDFMIFQKCRGVKKSETKSFLQLMKLLVNGDYFRFSRKPVLAAAKDFYRCIA